jgi:hypothetical protein
MATVNIGNIKFTWQGAYNASTAYAVDDIVSYNGSSYVCILASTGNLPTNTTYWNVMAEAGTDADIASISGLAQGDILYYNGTAWVRLGAGTSGQVLQTNGASANPSWADASSGLLLATYHSVDTSTRSTTNTSSYTKASNTLDIALTPASTSSKIHLLWVGQMNNNTASRRTHFSFFRDSTNLADPTSTQEISGAYSAEMPASVQYLDTPNTTSSITYSVQIKANAGDEAGIKYSRFHIWEYAS